MGNQSSGSNGAAATSSKAAPGSPAKPSPAKKRKWDPETEKKFDETNLTGFFDSLAAFKPESKRQLLAFLASNDEAFEIRTGAVTKKRVDGGVLIEYTPYDRNHNLLTEKDGVKVDAWETMDPSVHFSFVIPYETYVLYKILSSAVE